jgi:hypothetical protein
MGREAVLRCLWEQDRQEFDHTTMHQMHCMSEL